MPLAVAEIPVVINGIATAENLLVASGVTLGGVAMVGGSALLLGLAVNNFLNEEPDIADIDLPSIPEQISINQDDTWVLASEPDPVPFVPPSPQTVDPFNASKYDEFMQSIAQYQPDFQHPTPYHPVVEALADKIVDDLEKAVQAGAIAGNMSDQSKPDLSGLKDGIKDAMTKTAKAQAAGAEAPKPSVSEQLKTQAQKEQTEAQKQQVQTQQEVLDETKKSNDIQTDLVNKTQTTIDNQTAFNTSFLNKLDILIDVISIISNFFKSENQPQSVKIVPPDQCFPIKFCDEVYEKTQALFDIYMPSDLKTLLSTLMPLLVNWWNNSKNVDKDSLEQILTKFLTVNNNNDSQIENKKNIAETFKNLKVNVFAQVDTEGQEI